MPEDDLLLRVLRGEEVIRPPVWLMRQAGRVLPAYRALRTRIPDFKKRLTDPALICEITLQPLHALNTDAAILFSDILVLPGAMGFPFTVEEGAGPRMERTITGPQDIDTMDAKHVMEHLGYVTEGIHLVRKELPDGIPLIGFAGAPWTLFAYMVEGEGSKTFSKARAFLYTWPEAAHSIMERIAEASILFLQAQVEAGVSVIQLFDSWAGLLTPEQYRVFALPYIEVIFSRFPDVPKILFPRGAWFAMEEFRTISCEAISLDWNMEPEFARSMLGPEKILQGNFDPCLLFADKSQIRKTTLENLKRFGRRHIANLGHGLYPGTPLENVCYFIELIRNYRYEKE